MNCYATHLPLLITCAAHSTGPIIEFGCGNFSTPVLHELCRVQKRLLVTADSDQAWLSKFKVYESELHQFFHVQLTANFENTGSPSDEDFRRWEEFKEPDTRTWDVALIDHRPGERRKFEIVRMLKCTRFVVVHDTEGASYLYEPALNSAKYRYNYCLLRPWTTVVSNVDDLNFLA